MVSEMLLKEVREKIKMGISEGVIKSNLLQEGYGLSEIEIALDSEMKGKVVKSKLPEKDGNWVQAIGLTFLGLVIALGGAFIALKFIKKEISVPDINSLSSIGKTTQGENTKDEISVETSPTLSPDLIPFTLPDLLATEDYVNNTEKYKIRPPKNWEVDTSGRLGAPIYFFGPEATAEGNLIYKANINVLTGPSNNNSLDGYVEFYLDSLKKDLEKLLVLEQNKFVVSGRQFEMIRGTFEKDGIKFRMSTLLFVDATKVYVITGLALDSAYQSVKETMDLSMYSFGIL